MNTNQNQLTVEKEVAHYRDIWQHVCSDLNKHYGESLYKSWFSKINFLEASTTTVILSTPTNFIRDWIKSRYARDILQSWQSYDKDIKSIEIVTKELLEQNPNIPEYLAKIPSIKEGMDINSEGIFSALDLRFTFENFVVGGPNELAYAASRAVAESESAVAESNPLFLYGGVGLGKTHLMHAIAWYIRHNNPTRKVIYMSAEKFMYQFIKALRNKDVMSFKEE
ncbi:MAG: chromosomal replication initiator protein DnaA, partial [Rickettsia sp.]|nr:chromosomal replication initiator protein DnaA [Rickettsia sp.]